MGNSSRQVRAYADSWDEYWEDPQALPSGWTVDTTGADPDTVASYVEVDTGYAIQLAADADGYPNITKTFGDLASATKWECRAEIKIGYTGSGYYAFSLRDGTYQYAIRTYTSTLYYRTPSSASAVQIDHTMAVNDWVTITLRRDANGLYSHVGPQLVGVTPISALYTDATNSGLVTLGYPVLGATSTIRRFGLRLGGWNNPPERVFAGTTHGR